MSNQWYMQDFSVGFKLSFSRPFAAKRILVHFEVKSNTFDGIKGINFIDRKTATTER